MTPRLPLLLPPLLALLTARDGHAQPRDPAAAEALFAEGRALLDQDRIPEACAKLEASQRLDPADGTLLNLADCYARADRLASAWLTFRRAASEASARGRHDRASHARDRAASLEPRLCRLRIVVANGAPLSPASTVLRDDVRIDPLTFGEPLPVDRGAHVVVVREADATTFEETVRFEPSSTACETKTVTVTLPLRAPSRPSPSPSPQSAARVPHSSSRSLLPLGVAGLGLVGMGVGTAVGFSAKSTWDDAQSRCEPRGCGDEAQALASDARREAAVGTVVFVAGAAVLTAGVVWWLARGSAPSPVASRPALVVF